MVEQKEDCGGDCGWCRRCQEMQEAWELEEVKRQQQQEARIKAEEEFMWNEYKKSQTR